MGGMSRVSRVSRVGSSRDESSQVESSAIKLDRRRLGLGSSACLGGGGGNEKRDTLKVWTACDTRRGKQSLPPSFFGVLFVSRVHVCVRARECRCVGGYECVRVCYEIVYHAS